MTRKRKPLFFGETAADAPMTEAQHGRALGYFHYDVAPEVAAEFRQILKEAGYVDGLPRTHEEAIRRQINVTVSATLVSMAAAILTTVPGTRRGVRPKLRLSRQKGWQMK